MRINRLYLPAVAAFLMGFLTIPVNADPVTIHYDTVVTGAPPGGAVPWLTATFVDAGPNQVRLTLAAAGLINAEFVTRWFFNFDPSLNLSLLSVARVSGPPTTISQSPNGIPNGSSPGDSGRFDLEFRFTINNCPTCDRFQALETVVLNLTYGGLPGLMDAHSFSFLSYPNNTSATPRLTLAHIQGIGDNANLSSWVTGSEAVPEPATLVLLGAGLLGLGLFHRRVTRPDSPSELSR